MEIVLETKFHNKFEIEVRNIRTNEITKGYAYNMILNNFFTSTATLSSYPANRPGYRISFGTGTGILDGSRTTLFTHLGIKIAEIVEIVKQQPPLVSYRTSKIVLTPSEYIGAVLTEVGISTNDSNTTIFTHALIKDSEGNPLVLGPKTSEQEITIYSTIYLDLSLEEGITLTNPSSSSIIDGFIGDGYSWLRRGSYSAGGYGPKLKMNGDFSNEINWANLDVGKIGAESYIILTNLSNGKGKQVDIHVCFSHVSYREELKMDLVVLAENNSSIWSGYEFNNTLIGTGDGIETNFDLLWDEVWLEKPKKVYIDGIEKLTGVTWEGGKLIFDTPPSDTLNITADYWVKYLPKDINHEVRASFSINFAEGVLE